MPLSPDRHARPGSPMRCSPPSRRIPETSCAEGGCKPPVLTAITALHGPRTGPAAFGPAPRSERQRRHAISSPRPVQAPSPGSRRRCRARWERNRQDRLSTRCLRPPRQGRLGAMAESRPPRSAPAMRQPRIGQMRAATLVALAETDRAAMGRAHHCPSRSGAARDPVQAPGTQPPVEIPTSLARRRALCFLGSDGAPGRCPHPCGQLWARISTACTICAASSAA